MRTNINCDDYKLQRWKGTCSRSLWIINPHVLKHRIHGYLIRIHRKKYVVTAVCIQWMWMSRVSSIHHDMISPLCLARREPGSNMTPGVTLTRGWVGRPEMDCFLVRDRDSTLLEFDVESPGFANRTCRSWKRTYDWTVMSNGSKWLNKAYPSYEDSFHPSFAILLVARQDVKIVRHILK